MLEKEQEAKAVTHGIGHLERFIEISHADNGKNGAEDFVLSDGGIGGDVVEDRGSDEMAAIVDCAGQTLTAEQELRFFLADFNIMQIGFQLRVIDGGAHVDSRLESVAGAKLGSAFDEQCDETVRNGFLDDDAAGRGAALPG